MDNLHYEKFQDGTVKCIEDEIPFELPTGGVGTIVKPRFIFWRKNALNFSFRVLGWGYSLGNIQRHEKQIYNFLAAMLKYIGYEANADISAQHIAIGHS